LDDISENAVLKPVRFALLLLVSASLASAGAFSYTGTFTQDDDVSYMSFLMTAYGSVTIQSWGFGGGTNAAGVVIPSGGFASVLTLISPDDSVYSDSGSGGCGGCNVDPVFGGTSDAYINLLLDPGLYRVAITELDNGPAGAAWSDGLTRAGQGNFTEAFGYVGGPSAPFVLMDDGSKRTGAWAVDISGDYAEAAVPEPASLALAALGLALLLAPRRRPS
jgi:hypothetical protein